MAPDEPVAMADSEITELLDRGGTGVLSLARENVPYATPVSYGYDPDGGCFYLRLGFLDDSEKRGFVDASAEARLVVYERVDDEWRSVIATGALERVRDDELTVDDAAALRQSDLPLLDIWDGPVAEIEFELYRLVVDRMTGRRGAGGVRKL